MKIQACLSHKSDEWATPKKIYDYFINDLGCFDPYPMERDFDGLQIEWKENNFVNPPYSQISKWVDKALEEREKGKKSVMLLPSRTDTKWFAKLFENHSSFIFITGRLHFNETKEGAPFPSMFVALEPNGYADHERAILISIKDWGKIIE